MSEGQRLYQEMLDGGAPQGDVDEWAVGLRQQMLDGGAPPDEVAKYWGDRQDPDMTRARNVLRANLGRLTPTEAQRAAENPIEVFTAGLQMSSAGLAVRKQLPSVVLSDKASLTDKLIYGAAMVAGDLPAGIIGTGVGLAAGLPGGPTGMVVGAGAGGAGAPALLREILIDQYQHPDGAKTWGEVWDRMAHIAWETTIETATGAAAGYAGAKVAGAVRRTSGSLAAGTGAGLLTMAGVAVGAGSALRGHMPDQDDFVTAAILALGLHGAGKFVGARYRFEPNQAAKDVIKNLQDQYARTGILPLEATDLAAKGDLGLRTEILAPRNAAGELHTPGFDALRKPEPENDHPYKPAIDAKALDEPPAPRPPEPAKVERPPLARVEEREKSTLIKSTADEGDLLSLHVGSVKGQNAVYAGIVTVGEPRRGKGVATALYEKAVEYADEKGLPLRSDISVSADAIRVYEGLRRRGYQVTEAPGTTTSKSGKTNTEAGYVYEVRPPVREAPPRPLSPIESVEPPLLAAVADLEVRPAVMRSYGLSPEKMADPVYAENGRRVILADLNQKYMHDLADVLLAYHSGIERTDAWIAGGRNFRELPVEQQRFLQRMEAEGLIDRGYNEMQEAAVHRLQGEVATEARSTSGKITADAAVQFGINTFAKWSATGRDPNDIVVRVTKDGTRIPEPQAIAGYLQEFGRIAGFIFQISPTNTASPTGRITKGEAGPFQVAHKVRDSRGNLLVDARFVNIPDNTDVLMRRWFGLGRSEVIYHEVGHALDAFFNSAEGGGTLQRATLPANLRAEVWEASQAYRVVHWRRVGTVGSKYDAYMHSPVELMADAFAQYMSNPSIRARMPEFGRVYGERLQQFIDAADQYLPRRVGEDPNTGKAKWEPPPVDEQPAAGGGGKKPPGGQPPEERPPGGGPKKNETDLTPMTNDELITSINSIVASEVKQGVIARWLSHAQDWARLFEGRLAAADRLDKDIGMVKEGDKTTLSLSQMARLVSGFTGRAGQFLRVGTVDAATQRVTNQEVFYHKAYDIVREAGGRDDGFQAYRLAKRIVEKAEQGIEFMGEKINAEKLAHAQQFLANKENVKMYEEGHRHLQQVKDGLLLYEHDSGMLSGDQVIRMKQMNHEHIHIQRVVTPDYAPPPTGRGFRVRDPNKLFKGDERQIIDPVSTDVDNFYARVAIADNNRFMLGLVGMFEAYVDQQPKRLANGTRDNPYFTVREADQPTRRGEGDVFDSHGNPIPKAEHPAIEPFLTVRAFTRSRKANEFLYFDNGKPMVLTAKHEDLALLLTDIPTSNANILARVLTHSAKLERAGITAAPDYLLRSMWYGQLSKGLAEGGSKRPFSNFIEATVVVWTGNETWQKFVSSGGAVAAMADIDVNYVKRDIQAVLAPDSAWHQSVANTVRHPLDAARTVILALDNIARVAGTLDAVQKGYAWDKSVALSRTMHIDYNEAFRQPFLNSVSQMVPFFKTGIRDIGMVIDAVTNRPGTLLAVAASYYVLPTVANYVANYIADNAPLAPGETAADRAKKSYGNVDRWARDTYWVLPEMAGVRMKIPRGMGPMTAFFATFTERALDWTVKNDPAAFKGLLASMAGTAAPPYMPSLTAPIAEHVTGLTNNFTRPLIPASTEKASGYMQYGHDTTETSKAITRILGPAGIDAVNWSPTVVDNYARKWLGTVPMEFAKVVEGFWKTPTRPHEGVADTPFLRAFFMRRPMAGQVAADFYSELKVLTESHSDLRLAIQRGNPNMIGQPGLMRAAAQLTTLTNSLSQQRNAIEIIYNLPTAKNPGDKGLTVAEKIKQTDAIASGYVATAQAGLTTVRAIKAGIAKSQAP